MANQENMTKGMSQTQNAIEFINKSVLKPDVKPMKGTASPMIDQATGMMVQDLQSFLKGFEQVGLVALARLANNILTHGTYFGPKPSDDANMKSNGNTVGNISPVTPNPNAEQIGSDVMKGLFSVVGEYGKMKAEISSLIHNKHSNNDGFNPDSTASHSSFNTPKESSSKQNNKTTSNPNNEEHIAHTPVVEKKEASQPKSKDSVTNDNNDTHSSAITKEHHKNESHDVSSTAGDTEKTSQPKNSEKDNFTNSLKEIDDIFEPLLDTAEKLSSKVSESEPEFEQTIEDEMNDHDTDNNDDENDEQSGKKTYWFPKKK